MPPPQKKNISRVVLEQPFFLFLQIIFLLVSYPCLSSLKLGLCRISGPTLLKTWMLFIWIILHTYTVYVFHYFFRVGPDIRPFSIFGRIPDIKTIWIPDIQLISNAGYPLSGRMYCNLPDIENGQISDRNPISGIRNQPDIRNSTQP